MKFTKMSLVAALLVGSSAFALDNLKVSGDAKLYYTTTDAMTGGVNSGVNATGASTATAAATAQHLRMDDSLFQSENSAAQAALGLGVTADLMSGVSAGAHATVLTTLGLQGQLVGQVWEGTNGTHDSWIMDEAWVAATLGKTTAKLGRMELDTPLVFSEKWSIVANTFEAVVALNQDLPDTTLVGAYVGGSNGQLLGRPHATAGEVAGIANVVDRTQNETTFSQFYGGAYAVAAINNSFKPLTVQAWYFDAVVGNTGTAGGAIDVSGGAGTNFLNGVEALWLQADLACQKVPGLMAGVQYVDTTFQTAVKDVDTDAVAVQLGYSMKDVATVKVAYSEIDKAHSAGFNLAGTGQSKLYTEAWWNYGYVTQADTESVMVSASTNVAGIDLMAQYTDADQTATAGDNDMTEVTVTASKSFGPLDATLAYINADIKTATVGDDETSNTVQAYLTLNF